MDNRLITEIDWSPQGTRWICSLIYYDGQFSQLRLASGQHLSFKVEPRRYCRGYIRPAHSKVDPHGRRIEAWRQFVPCPRANEVKGRHQCSLCYSLDDRKPCMKCKGTHCTASSPTRDACRRSVSYVYLASFGRKQVKVGAVSEGRIPLRWIEQGANVAKRCLIGNGEEVRRFEHTIHEQLEVLPALQTRKKVDTLWNFQVKAEIDCILKMENAILRRFPNYPHYSDAIHNLIPLYDLTEIPVRPIEVRIKPNLQLAGTIIGVKGALLVIEIRGTHYLINLKDLLGRKITCETDDSSPLQTTLDHV